MDTLSVAPIQAWMSGASVDNGLELRAGNASFNMLDGTNSPEPPFLALVA